MCKSSPRQGLAWGSCAWDAWVRTLYGGRPKFGSILDSDITKKLIKGEEIKIGTKLVEADPTYVCRKFQKSVLSECILQEPSFEGRLCLNQSDYQQLCKDKPFENIKRYTKWIY